MILIYKYSIYSMVHSYNIDNFNIDFIKWYKKAVYIDTKDKLTIIHWFVEL